MASVTAERNFPGGTVAMRLVGEAFVAGSAIVVGDVKLGADTSVWPFTCIRGDVAPIRVGARCSIQDQVMLHTRSGEALEIGGDVAIGHQACVHCRRVGDGCLIGIGATVLDGAVLGEGLPGGGGRGGAARVAGSRGLHGGGRAGARGAAGQRRGAQLHRAQRRRLPRTGAAALRRPLRRRLGGGQRGAERRRR